MATHADRQPEAEREIRLVENPDGWWTAIDESVDVASQGETRTEALRNLDEAVALHEGEAGEPIEDEAAFLEDLGIDSEEVAAAREKNDELPDFMQ